jgi:hypothetical protein
MPPMDSPPTSAADRLREAASFNDRFTSTWVGGSLGQLHGTVYWMGKLNLDGGWLFLLSSPEMSYIRSSDRPPCGPMEIRSQT